MWSLQWGQYLPTLEALSASGAPVPALDARPAVPLWLIPAWQCFADLIDDRPVGFGAMGGIPWSAIMAWGRLHRVGDLEILLFHVKHLDRVFRSWRPSQNASS